MDSPTKVMADAGPVGLGAILIKEQHGIHRVVSYASRSLTPVERRYSQTEKEALGLVWACEKFHPLIRKEDIRKEDNIENETEDYVRFVAISATPRAVNTHEIERASAEDDDLFEVRKCLDTGRWDGCDNRYYEVEIMKSTTADKTINVFRKVFARHGLPIKLYSDNGPQFIAYEFKAYMDECGIDHHKAIPKWPQANGEVERQNQSLEKRMKIAQAQGGDWKIEILKYIAAYRAKPHPSTGQSPAELLFGRKLRTKIPELGHGVGDDLEIRDRDAELKGKAKLYADKRWNASESDIKVGEMVFVKQDRMNKMDTPFRPGPYTVVRKTGSKVTVESPAGVRYDRNLSFMKRYNTPNITIDDEITEEPEPTQVNEQPTVQNRADDTSRDETTGHSENTSCGTAKANKG
ncbi:uncharacterized protein K02A2.6-like [Lineus longissimus]|uniref:uncharacterized protein K02A2.6-like n=1 Tax=Lineus longissimus TaxID=88925 RepID=UPI00315D04BF